MGDGMIPIGVGVNRNPVEVAPGADAGPNPGMSLAARVREARLARGYGVNQLDRILGKNPGYISRVETGLRSRLAYDQIAHIAEGLKVNTLWLATGEGPRDLESPTGAALRQLAEASGIPLEYVERAERAQHSDGGKRETPLVTLRRAEWLWKVETGQVDPPDTYGDDFGGPKPKGLPNKKR